MVFVYDQAEIRCALASGVVTDLVKPSPLRDPVGYNIWLIAFCSKKGRLPLMRSDHQLHETRSLRMHRMVAERYRDTPEAVIQFGLENLKKWQQQGVDCEDFRMWEEILRDRPQILPAMLCGSGEEAVRMRQSSPFAGLIPEDIRRQILASTS